MRNSEISFGAQKELRVTPGVHFKSFEPSVLTQESLGLPFEVTGECNRMGLRLRPIVTPADSEQAGLARRPHARRPGKTSDELVSLGTTWGTIQISGDGHPFILFVDNQTTGGYPQIATVIGADQSRLAQLRPGDKIYFKKIDFTEAEKLFKNLWRSLESLDWLA
jgi:antagonist of KipI